MKYLEVDETLGQLLVAEGFSTIDHIKDCKLSDLVKIEGIEEETAKELIERAIEFHKKNNKLIITLIIIIDNDKIIVSDDKSSLRRQV